MNRDRSVLYRAFFLLLGCICYRIFFGLHPEWLPNISPMIAVALVGTMYLPRAWGWLIAPAVMVLSDAAFLTVNQQVQGSIFSFETCVTIFLYAAFALLGLALARNKSLVRIAGASVLCSVIFYVVANTISWWANSTPASSPAYPVTLAGWWQANTVGLPGWVPTWTFLRNGLLGDLFFCGLLVAIFDRQLLLHPARAARPATAA